MYRSRKSQKFYEKRHRTTTGCPFCDPSETNYRLVEETKHLMVILNKPPYEVWEGHKVTAHLMVIPKRHVGTLADLSDTELLDVSRVIARYESEGYNVYARGVNSSRRTVAHQHTHLIQIDPKEPRLSLYLKKPYVTINL